MRQSKTKANQDAAPASQTRVKATHNRPKAMPDFDAADNATRLAEELDALRVKQAEFAALEEELLPRLIDALDRSDKKNVNTQHGRVSLLPATESKQVFDEEAAVALLAAKGIPQPSTLADVVRQNDLIAPTKTKPGLKLRIKFEMNK